MFMDKSARAPPTAGPRALAPGLLRAPGSDHGRPLSPARLTRLAPARAADDWSDDELEDLGDTLVVPMSMVPTPQVLSSGGNSSVGSEEGAYRASAYNERMARARSATMAQRKSQSGGARAAAARRPALPLPPARARSRRPRP